jgi:hypothetical protein
VDELAAVVEDTWDGETGQWLFWNSHVHRI